MATHGAKVIPIDFGVSSVPNNKKAQWFPKSKVLSFSITHMNYLLSEDDPHRFWGQMI
jgi:hypothetical protein